MQTDHPAEALASHLVQRDCLLPGDEHTQLLHQGRPTAISLIVLSSLRLWSKHTGEREAYAGDERSLACDHSCGRCNTTQTEKSR